LSELEVQFAVVPSCRQEQEGSCQKWHSEDIQNAKEDEATRDRDLVSTVVQTIGDRVQKPHEDEIAADNGVVCRDADPLRRYEALVQDGGGEEEVGECAEREESPLIVRGCKSTSEPSGNPCPGQGNIVCDSGPANTGDETNGNNEGCPADKPIDVFGVEDLSGARFAEGIGNLDGDIAKIRCHGEVCDGAGKDGDREEVVEDLLAGTSEVGEADDDEHGETVNGTDGL